jgi:isohexenylglutaconyl-CoA hydratase
MVDELLAALAAAEADGVTRVVVLGGAGGHFCAGADLKDMAAARSKPSADGDPVAHVNSRFGWLCAAFARTPLAVVAVVEGTVMGGGFGLACAADVTLAHASASFRLPETSLGLVPAQIAPYLVERLGFAEAKRLAVTGGRLDARTALTLRLVHELAEDEAALAAALAKVLERLGLRRARSPPPNA